MNILPAGPISGETKSNIEPDLTLMLGNRIEHTKRIIKGYDSNGKSTINQYSILSDLGEGSFGVVKLIMENETSRKFAMKMFSKSRLRK